MDRKTARRYVAAAEAVSVVRDGGDGQLTDAVIGMVVEAVRPRCCDGQCDLPTDGQRRLPAGGHLAAERSVA